MASSKSRTGKLTYADYERIPDDGLRHEIIDGEHCVSPAPYVDHQTISTRLLVQLYLQIEAPGLGKVLPAPTDVVLSPNSIVQPDILSVLAHRLAIVTQKNIQGAPDLIVEIISSSSRRMDLGRKHELYEKWRVPEYWVVDGEARVVHQFLLVDERYAPAIVCTDHVVFPRRRGVRIDLTRVWD
jgi:Uma2 family endonuclease